MAADTLEVDSFASAHTRVRRCRKEDRQLVKDEGLRASEQEGRRPSSFLARPHVRAFTTLHLWRLRKLPTHSTFLCADQISWQAAGSRFGLRSFRRLRAARTSGWSVALAPAKTSRRDARGACNWDPLGRTAILFPSLRTGCCSEHARGKAVVIAQRSL
eukprot:2332218-Pleurochrysis_carterae.AAC.1